MLKISGIAARVSGLPGTKDLLPLMMGMLYQPKRTEKKPALSKGLLRVWGRGWLGGSGKRGSTSCIYYNHF
jgi:hypothetical protein